MSTNDDIIEQPWNDDRLKMNGRYIGCVTKDNADYIMALQNRVIFLELIIKRKQRIESSKPG